MSIRTLLAAAVAMGAVAGSAHAQLKMEGSDTLFTLTTELVNLCPGITAANIEYIGGGSSNGEKAILRGSQQLAPMSRFLQEADNNKGPCMCDNGTPNDAGCTDATLAEGYGHSLDGLAIVRDENTQAGCDGIAFNTTLTVTDQDGNGLDCPGCNASNQYTFADFKDALRVLFAGIHHNSAGGKVADKNCGSDVRRTLANNWSNFFQTACATEGCTKMRHAFRRGDFSGTTDTFLSLLDLDKISNVPFCNGDDQQDLDPIRRSCEAGEQVCGSDGTLGLLLPTLLPEGVDLAVAHNASPCEFGLFDWDLMPVTPDPVPPPCPNGTQQAFGKCLYPRDAQGNAGCLNIAFNTPFGPSVDGRAYNLILRNAAGAVVKDSTNPPFGKAVEGAYYRLHTNRVNASDNASNPAGASGCSETSSTRQIGCLAQASPCSLGFAGREASDSITDSAALRVNNISPTDANVRLLLTGATGAYPLARILYANTVVGFAGITGDEKILADCFKDRFYVDDAATAAGFITLSATPCAGSLGGTVGDPLCQITPTDFNEATCPL